MFVLALAISTFGAQSDIEYCKREIFELHKRCVRRLIPIRTALVKYITVCSDCFAVIFHCGIITGNTGQFPRKSAAQQRVNPLATVRRCNGSRVYYLSERYATTAQCFLRHR